MNHHAKGGHARAAALSPERRSEIGKLAAAGRWKGTGGKKPPETFGTKLYGMKEDLASIVTRMNADDQPDKALAAQEAVGAVYRLLGILDDDVDREWKKPRKGV